MIYRDQTVSLMSTLPRTLDYNNMEKALKEPYIIGDNYLTLSTLSPSEFNPQTYWDPIVTDAASVWEEGYRGDQSLVAIIDTGIWTQHYMFNYTNFLGGIDLSFDNASICDMFGYYPPWYGDTTFLGWDNPNNHWHGSHVAGIIAGWAVILLPENDSLVQAIERYGGVELPSGEPYGYPGYKLLTLSGIAPYATLYIVKVFDHTGAGIPESLVLMALEHVISLKESGVDIDVINMSLGGPTL